MRLTAFCVLIVLGTACASPAEESQAQSVPADPAASASTDAPSRAPAVNTGATFPLRVEGRTFVDADGKPFEWRGITAFRLAEMIARGREEEAAAYLDWARTEQLTVVRVLLMARHLFTLTPAEGRAALPVLLDMARARGIVVEVVALADTQGLDLDYEAHIREVGRISVEKGNALVEIANEPGHPTQDPRLHDPAFAKRLASLLPEPLVVALGSFEYGEGYADGDYATTHVPRGDEGWDHVFEVAALAERVVTLKKPVVSDEPIGAGPEYQPGRRDTEPRRFAAAAALTRLVGMEATFHYDGGLHARLPQGPEAACLAAWHAGLALVPGRPAGARFLRGTALDAVAQFSGARAGMASVSTDRVILLLVDPASSWSVEWTAGWEETGREEMPGAAVIQARRTQ
jgi:hypothetical protein